MKSQKIEQVTKEQIQIILGALFLLLSGNMKDISGGILKDVNKQIMFRNTQTEIINDNKKSKKSKK